MAEVLMCAMCAQRPAVEHVSLRPTSAEFVGEGQESLSFLLGDSADLCSDCVEEAVELDLVEDRPYAFQPPEAQPFNEEEAKAAQEEAEMLAGIEFARAGYDSETGILWSEFKLSHEGHSRYQRDEKPTEPEDAVLALAAWKEQGYFEIKDEDWPQFEDEGYFDAPSEDGDES